MKEEELIDVIDENDVSEDTNDESSKDVEQEEVKQDDDQEDALEEIDVETETEKEKDDYKYEMINIEDVNAFLTAVNNKHVIFSMIFSSEKLIKKIIKVCKKNSKKNIDFLYALIFINLKELVKKSSAKKGYKLFKKIKENNNYYYSYFYGEFLRLGFIKQEDVKLEEYLKESINNGMILSNISISHCYRLGLGADINETLAYQHMSLAADKGVPYARMMKAHFLLQGYGCNHDYEEAYSILKDLIDHRYYKAKCDYYNALLNIEKGITDEEIFKILKKESKNSCDLKMLLGFCYLMERGTKKNYSKAKKILVKCADNKVFDACYYLGIMHFNGWKCRKSYDAALEIFGYGKKNGSYLCKQIIDERYIVNKHNRGKVKEGMKGTILL